MSGPGPIALLGGGEHRHGCESIDRWLLERTGRADPSVVVLPAASTPAMLPHASALARTWWSALGARVSVLHPGDLGAPATSETLARADCIVLPGGVPGRLVAALGAGPTWDLVLARWRIGAALAGSSAGVMALFTWRLGLTAPRPLRLVPGLGPLAGHVAVPHFDRLIVRPRLGGWAARVQRRFDGLGVLGIDERTAVIVDGGAAHVRGRGVGTVVARGRTETARAGELLPIGPCLLPLPARVSRRRGGSSPPSPRPSTPARARSATAAVST